MIDNTIRVLLIEDNPDDVYFLEQLFKRSEYFTVGLSSAYSLGDGIVLIEKNDFDIILLDLSLPDSDGFWTLEEVRKQKPDIPIIVFTGTHDEDIGIEAVKKGAEDYLVKGYINKDLILRAIRYAIERRRLREKVEQARERNGQQREIRSVGRLSGDRDTQVTARAYGQESLRVQDRDLFEGMVEEYSKMLQKSLEKEIYQTNINVSKEIRDISDQLGLLFASPRDVIDIHTAAMKRIFDGAPPAKTRAYMEEGRILVLELMGYLVSYYRNYAFGVTSKNRRT